MNETPAPAPATRRRALLTGLGAVALLALATAALLAPGTGRWFGAPAAPVFHGRDIGAEHWNPAFTLLDPSGQARSLADFRGRIVLLAFGYTHCPDVCPTTLAKFAEVRRLLGSDGARVQGLFVTIDPERDSAALLQAYVPAFDPSFIGLRGSEAQTDAVTKAFHANYQIVEYQGSVLVDHTASTYIVDAQGQARVVSPYDQPAAQLAEDVRSVLRQG